MAEIRFHGRSSSICIKHSFRTFWQADDLDLDSTGVHLIVHTLLRFIYSEWTRADASVKNLEVPKLILHTPKILGASSTPTEPPCREWSPRRFCDDMTRLHTIQRRVIPLAACIAFRWIVTFLVRPVVHPCHSHSAVLTPTSQPRSLFSLQHGHGVYSPSSQMSPPLRTFLWLLLFKSENSLTLFIILTLTLTLSRYR